MRAWKISLMKPAKRVKSLFAHVLLYVSNRQSQTIGKLSSQREKLKNLLDGERNLRFKKHGENWWQADQLFNNGNRKTVVISSRSTPFLSSRSDKRCIGTCVLIVKQNYSNRGRSNARYLWCSLTSTCLKWIICYHYPRDKEYLLSQKLRLSIQLPIILQTGPIR